MNEKIRKDCRPQFIPCGDSLEKMNQLSDEVLESVSGGCVNPQAEAEYDKSVCINSIVIQNGRREN